MKEKTIKKDVTICINNNPKYCDIECIYINDHCCPICCLYNVDIKDFFNKKEQTYYYIRCPECIKEFGV